jgi:excisionase family DNA binding protein
MSNPQERFNFLTLEEAAAVLKVSKRTLHRLIKEKKMPAVKIGNQWRIDETRLREWVDRRDNLQIIE